MSSDAPVTSAGEPAAAEALAQALRAPRRDDRVARSFTHGFHGYPARMHPATARALIELTLERAGRRGAKPPVVLDPFCGSGTVLVEARRVGARARGVDANPLAVLVARAKTAVGRAEQRDALRERGASIAGEVIEAGREARRADRGEQGERTPHGADPRRRQRELQHWFSPHVRRELEALASVIDREPRQRRAVLSAVLSSVLYKVSKRESETSAVRVEKKVARGAAARLFGRRVRELVDGLDALAAVDAPNVGVAEGDARKLGKLDIAPGSVDAIVTSPPYVGTYDYRDHHALRFAFLGLSPARFSRAEIGSRRGFQGEEEQRKQAFERWRLDLTVTLKEMARALRPGGQIAMVIGDSLAGERAVYADELVARCTPRSLRRVAVASQARTPYGSAEQRAFARHPKREHIILLEKTA